MKGIDPRGPRFGAAITSVVLAMALLLPQPAGGILAAIQWVVFGIGAFAGVRRQPYGLIYRRLLAPRLPPPSELEDPRPPTFAQAVGFTFLTVAVIAVLLSATLVYQVAVGFALFAALLNAVFNFCLGCEMYVLMRRMAGNTA